ncbi:YheC/YheD family protein [Neobacillus sp. OS1-2]|uniref:YheC/YheD family endospore coat-associated protein n=1 Tax=Neobacillus sp. OS1-2 TaxID=3070680 RepID=UPI0027DECEC7|nr:YheC/YheD family protein [Neobacillus sp. OS1-2]WML38637.1 YheC/YheD family protein [Neobacillus sp. OS1-2]
MTIFGIMTLTMESELSYINEMADLAESNGLEVFQFIPSAINPRTLQVKGRKFVSDTKRWMDAELPIPTIIYDRCFYGEDEHSKQCLPIVSWLKSRNDITFLGYGLPNKLDLYDAIKNSLLSSYLPKSQSVSDPTVVLSELSAMKKIILKPINGSQGYGIYYLKKNDKTYHVKTEKQKKIISRIFPNETKLIQWLKSLLMTRSYLLQPYLELSNNEQQPFDIRTLLQKNEHGAWVERGKGIRTGTTGGILSNLSAGGSVITFSEWLSSVTPAKGEYISQELDYILSKLPVILEKEFLPLFEIGVDIGIAKDGSIWILDLNSKPGRKVLLQTRPELQKTLCQAPLLYGKYLSQSEQIERKTNYEKTLSH